MQVCGREKHKDQLEDRMGKGGSTASASVVVIVAAALVVARGQLGPRACSPSRSPSSLNRTNTNTNPVTQNTCCDACRSWLAVAVCCCLTGGSACDCCRQRLSILAKGTSVASTCCCFLRTSFCRFIFAAASLGSRSVARANAGRALPCRWSVVFDSLCHYR